MAFHWKDNWFFSRNWDNGNSVVIEHWDNHTDHDAGKPPSFHLEIDAAGWASIVASVCEFGETNATWRIMSALHGVPKHIPTEKVES